MRRTAVSHLQHLVLIEWEKIFVLSRAPRKGVDAIKALYVIDAEQMKNAAHRAHALAPPL